MASELDVSVSLNRFNGMDSGDDDGLNFKSFHFTDHNLMDFEHDIDPDNNFFNNVNINCRYYSDEQFNLKIKLDHGMSVIHFNSRSLYANFQNIKEYISQLKKPFGVIAISETWISEGKGVNFEMDGYDFNYISRENRKGGGVALYVHSRFDYRVVDNLTSIIDNVMECITVEISLEKKKNVMVSCVYRPPGSDIELFMSNMEKMFDVRNKKVMFICGDFNLDLLNPTKHKQTDEFIDTMFSMSLFPTIIKPSRITTHSATLIDNIFTNCMDSNIMSGLLLNDISDHLPVFVLFDCDGVKHEEELGTRLMRVRTEESISSFRTNLMLHSWRTVYDETDTDKAYDYFLSTFNSMYSIHCPIKEVKMKTKRPDKPWMTNGLHKACRKKNILYKEFLKHRTIEMENKYKKYKNKLINIMRICKKDYYNTMIDNNKNNIKGLWKVLNNIIRNEKSKGYPQYFMNNDKTIDNMNEVVNGFNDFFVNVGPKLAEEISKPQPEEGKENVEDYLVSNSSSMFLNAVNEHEILDIVNNCKNKMSTDWNDIDMALIKKVIDAIVKPLTHIFNLSFGSGVFPSKMKTAKVIPLYKEGDRKQFTNYRPVSLLSQFSKILEKLFALRLDKFIDKYDLLTECQYGFRANRTTSMALIDLIEKITSAIDDKKFAVGIFIDLKKAFDTIDHKLLIKKLEKYGIRGSVRDWMNSYITDRQQFVQIGDNRSNSLGITCGVPQGSVLGPKLFNLYINDICRVSSFLKFILFADDTNIFCSGENLQQLLQAITAEMSNLKRWFDLNKLSLNVKKTKLMIFGNRKINSEVNVMIDNIVIERVFETKFLGVILDHKICWKPHVKYVKTKTARSIGVLAKARYFLNERALYTLYYSFVLPYLSYCLEVWGNTYKTTVQPLFILQKRAIRIVNNTGYLNHTNALFLKMHTLKLRDLIDFKTVLIMYKANKKLLPGNIQTLFTERKGNYSFRRELNMKQQSVRTNIKGFCISVFGVVLWNGLEEKIQKCTSEVQLKKLYKKTFFSRYSREEEEFATC